MHIFLLVHYTHLHLDYTEFSRTGSYTHTHIAFKWIAEMWRQIHFIFHVYKQMKTTNKNWRNETNFLEWNKNGFESIIPYKVISVLAVITAEAPYKLGILTLLSNNNIWNESVCLAG